MSNLTYNSKPFKKQVLLQVLSYPIEQISSSKLLTIPHAYRLIEQIYGAKVTTSEKFQLTNDSKPLKKQVLL